MPRIRVLDKQIAELIAAGEVVERPSSVIKELVENSVDAGATVITVEIRRGGTTFMRVTDNGCGISADDVPTAFMRHATSKIAMQDDLDSIATLGFRGEALASICAVSRVELLTRTPDAETGVRYVGGGEEYSVEEAGCPAGTTIIVRDLFYNTPARMKFLKKDTTEGNSIAGIIDKIALSHPEISFRFIRDGKEQLHTPGDGKLSSAIYAVYGKDFSSSLIPVDYEYEHVRVYGFVSTPSASRPNRTMQSFFINGRYVRSRTAAAALEAAFKGSVMVGKFPACVLHIEVAFAAVDVNIHPAKMEIRFVNEKPIFDSVYHAVKSALNAGDKPKVMEFKPKPSISPFAPREEKAEQTVLPTAQKKSDFFKTVEIKPQKPSIGISVFSDSERKPEKPLFTPTKYEEIIETVPVPEPVLVKEPPKAEPVITEERTPEKSETAREESVKPEPAVSDYHSRIIGEAFGTYIIVEYSKDELLLIDKHAAHERLLYEKLKKDHAQSDAQTLLEPVPVMLDKDEYTAVLAHSEELLKSGFEVDDFGVGTVLLRTVPLMLDGKDAADALMEIAGYLASNKTDMTTEYMDWVYHNVACRAAIKAGDNTTHEELVALAQELQRNPEVRYCPHGRPVYIVLRRRDIERQFGRV